MKEMAHSFGVDKQRNLKCTSKKRNILIDPDGFFIETITTINIFKVVLIVN